MLSGGPNSVHIADAPQLSPGFFEYCAEAGIPVLGICYGMQLLIHVRYPARDPCLSRVLGRDQQG